MFFPTRTTLGFGRPLLIMTLVGSGILPAQAQITQAIVQEIIDGDQVYIQETPAKIDDKADFGQAITTQESRTSLLFNNGAAGRLGRDSSVLVGQCVEVDKGELLISGPVNGCVAGLSVAVKGTLYVLQKDEEQNGTVKVIEGTVLVTSPDKPEEPVAVNAGEKISIIQGILSGIIPMSQDEIMSLLQGQLFSGFQIPITPEGALQAVCSRILPGLSCSTTGVPSYPIPNLPVSVPFPGFPF
jgi:hypothetical protein